jgi:hypothetical protein
MADPTANYCPRGVTDLKMMQDTTNDLSIGSAVKGTHASSTLYTNFDDLRNNATNTLMDTVYNASKITPTNTEMFRGYPKPTITMNYEIWPVIDGANTLMYLVADLPMLNNKIGYSLIITASIREERSDTSALLLQHDETFTYTAGSTVPSSSTATELETGVYQLTESDPTASYDIDATVTITVNREAYLADTTPYEETLLYVADQIYAHLFTPITALSCVGTFDVDATTTCYSYDSTLANGTTLYASTAMSSPISNNDYALDFENASNFNYGATSSGVISSYGECTA